MIILEGPDNAGKTTLAEALHRSFGYTVKKSPGPHQHPGSLFNWSIEWLQISRMFRGRLCFDRFPYFSEQIYGWVLRDGPVFSSEELSELKVELMRSSPLVIFCFTFDANIGRDGKEQMEGVVSHYEEIRQAYSKFFNPYYETHGWFSTYDYTRPELVHGTWTTVADYVRFLEPVRRKAAEEIWRS